VYTYRNDSFSQVAPVAFIPQGKTSHTSTTPCLYKLVAVASIMTVLLARPPLDWISGSDTSHLAQQLLLCPQLEMLSYHTILQPVESYVCGIALRVDAFTNSQMGRGIVWTLAEQDGREDLYSTTITHLESFLVEDDNGGPERKVQLSVVIADKSA
jgi:hypothetical protein